MQIALLSTSKRVSNAEAALIAQAVTLQFKTFTALWGLDASALVFYANRAAVPATMPKMTLVDQPDVDGALGYHDESGGVYEGFVFANPVLDNGGVTLFDPRKRAITVASVVSHEALELRGDPTATEWVDGPQIDQGNQYAREAADPVENDQVVVAIPGKIGPTYVGLSSYVYPAWFDTQAPAGSRFDARGRLSAPFTIDAGGYMIVRDADGNVNPVFGEKYPEWRKKFKGLSVARWVRRARK